MIHLRELRFSPHLGNIERCNNDVVEVKIKPSWAHYGSYGGSGATDIFILNLGNRWGWGVGFMTLPIYFRVKRAWYPLIRKLGLAKIFQYTEDCFSCRLVRHLVRLIIDVSHVAGRSRMNPRTRPRWNKNSLRWDNIVRYPRGDPWIFATTQGSVYRDLHHRQN